jgi:hypothetical protein
VCERARRHDEWSGGQRYSKLLGEHAAKQYNIAVIDEEL